MKSPQVQHSSKGKTQIATLLNLLHLFQKIDPEFPLQYAISLAVISQNEGMSLTSLSEKTGLALSTISRIVGALSDYRANGNPYGLVEIRLSPQERRKKELYLTEKGWKLINSIEALL